MIKFDNLVITASRRSVTFLRLLGCPGLGRVFGPVYLVAGDPLEQQNQLKLFSVGKQVHRDDLGQTVH